MLSLIILYGEIGGLQWKDIDFENRLIHILRATQWQKGKGIVEVLTKNYSSERVIRLPEFIFELLGEYRNYWNAQKLKLGNKWIGDDWVFIQENGKPISPNTMNKWLNDFIKENDLKHFTPHSLRHPYVKPELKKYLKILART